MDSLEINTFQIILIIISFILYDPILSRKINEWF